MTLQTPLQDAGRSMKNYASRLEKLDIRKLEDFLYHIPSRYDDFSLLTPIASVQVGETVTLKGTVKEMRNEYTRRFKKIQHGVIEDETGSIEITWFNQPYLTSYIHPGDTLSVSGRVELFGRKVILQSPEYEVLSGENPLTLHTGRLVPIYHETRGVSSKWLRRQIHTLLTNHAEELAEFLPEELRKQYHFPTLIEAISLIHFPNTFEDVIKARERLAFDELFIMQLAATKRRLDWEAQLSGHPMSKVSLTKQLEKLRTSLPFTLTDAQSQAVEDIFQDMASSKPMNRLVQGDVGSGKTVVGAFGMYLAYLHGFQSVMMAPTEILAEQHYASLKKLLEPLGVTVELVTGSKKLTTREKAHGNEARIEKRIRKTPPKDEPSIESDKQATFHILVGTHAVLSDKIVFDKLGLIVIDEQQRFGVEQRSIIRAKGDNPHFLTMTATPIPRTVALTMYGDLDVSYLNQMPKGRQVIKTWLVPAAKRDGAYDWIRKQIVDTDSQVFIICPFVEESENMQTVKAATVEFERLQKTIFPDLRLGMLHGKMKGKEKNEVLTAFKDKKYDILVATPVVEVGIDVPNATVIMIEASERFGLAQLHQLRGRVGRGSKQSYCLLFTESTSDKTIERLKAMETSHNGSELAELDFRLRGPGELYGTLQSGSRDLKIASFSDIELIQKAREASKVYLPKLTEYPLLYQKAEAITVKKVSPD